MRTHNTAGIINLCEVAEKILTTMPENAATKFAVRTVIREAINKSCPNYKGNNNKQNAKYISLKASKKPSHETIADHAIPISIFLREIYEKKIFTKEKINSLLPKYNQIVLITKEEDIHLKDLGYKKDMPENWDGTNPLARFEAAGIIINPLQPTHGDNRIRY